MLEDEQNIQHSKECKYLEIKITQNRKLNETISDRNVQGRRAISILNNILWYGNFSNRSKQRIDNNVVKSVVKVCMEARYGK